MARLGSCLPKAILYLLASFGIYSVLYLVAIILQTKHPDMSHEATITNLFISASIVLFVCIGLYGGWHRNALRKKFGLQGGAATDCLRHAFCHGCALCQEYRTISINVNGGKWTGPAIGGPISMVPPSGQYM
ncbi:hypothetical protein CBR_g51444 [Chara braunii]|uniref:Uncharacterized protein n=1 Tax=Chara braunii TaxID=69332 RepID=A0A388K6A4_CHABU|nr:hypothetical protein CBR_g51444 [Chara braunii]|eukprot:GBG65561.1 hypothetical protein CBR_g51444 [Chara braunii]